MLPNIAYAMRKTILRNLNYAQCLNIALMKKAWFIAPMEKALWCQWNITPWFIVPMEKARFYERFFFEILMVVVKDKKIRYKRYNVNKTKFYALRGVSKSNVNSSFWGIWTTMMVIIFRDFLVFYQTSLSPKVKRSAIISNKHGSCLMNCRTT